MDEGIYVARVLLAGFAEMSGFGTSLLRKYDAVVGDHEGCRRFLFVSTNTIRPSAVGVHVTVSSRRSQPFSIE
jgi:hypothetical protein